MQTFYVKPSDVPKPPNGPTSVAALEQRPQKILLMRGDKSYEFESNRPEGGFYISAFQATEDKAVRVPEQVIVKTLSIWGHTFVVHQHLHAEEVPYWSSEYVVTELSTGLRLSAAAGTAEEAEQQARKKAHEVGRGSLDKTIGGAKNIADKVNVEMNTEDWRIDAPKKMITDEEREAFAKELRDELLDGEDGGFTVSDVADWLEDRMDVTTTQDIEAIRNDVNDPWVLKQAIMENMDYFAAETKAGAINDILKLLPSAETMGYMIVQNMDYESISDWAKKHENNLTDGFDSYQYGVDYESGDQAVSAADVVAFAIDQDISLDTAQSQMEESIQQQESEFQAETIEAVDFADSNGKSWNGDDLHEIGRWVGGTVRSTRDAAKELDDCRRGENICPDDDNPIVKVVEDHIAPYTEGNLYRGTGNGRYAWLASQVGDVIPYGLASFSKSESQALGFDSTVLLIIEKTEDVENPIVGIDIQSVIEDGRLAGFDSAVTETGIASYEEEQEVILRAPALQVVRREANKVYVKPIDMKLLNIMKALFEDRIAAMERTFDYPLHREPEDAWK